MLSRRAGSLPPVLQVSSSRFRQTDGLLARPRDRSAGRTGNSGKRRLAVSKSSHHGGACDYQIPASPSSVDTCHHGLAERLSPVEKSQASQQPSVVDQAVRQSVDAIQTPMDKARGVEGALNEAAGRTADRVQEGTP